MARHGSPQERRPSKGFAIEPPAGKRLPPGRVQEVMVQYREPRARRGFEMRVDDPIPHAGGGADEEVPPLRKRSPARPAAEGDFHPWKGKVSK